MDRTMTSPLTFATLSQLDRDGFVAAVGAVFEHSPWVMTRVWEKRPFADRAMLRAAMSEVLTGAARAEVLALILAHPELASKAALRGELTADSAREQAGAGLDACTPAELAEIRQLNDAYRDKFGWPFIVAVRGLTRQDIIAAMRRRLQRDADEEFAEARAQVLRIADLRLDPLLSAT